MNITQEQLEFYLTELGFNAPSLPSGYKLARVVLRWSGYSGWVETTFMFRAGKFIYSVSYSKGDGYVELLTDFRE